MTASAPEPGGCFVQPDLPGGRDADPVFIVYVDWVERDRRDSAPEAEHVLREAVKDRGRIVEIG